MADYSSKYFFAPPCIIILLQYSLAIGLVRSIGEPRILHWRGFTWRGRAGGLGRSPPVGSRGKAPVVSLGDSPPKAKAKYEISVQL